MNMKIKEQQQQQNTIANDDDGQKHIYTNQQPIKAKCVQEKRSKVKTIYVNI